MFDAFGQISLILLLAVFAAFIAKYLKQPLIISYIVTGILVGPQFFSLLPEGEAIDMFMSIGVALLLFMVGLHLNPGILKSVGKASILGGLAQVFFTTILGYGFALLIGLSVVEAAYIALAITFSSTIIAMKILSDKGELDTLYGKIAIGFQVVQDITAMVIIVFLSSFTDDVNIVPYIAITLLSVVVLISVVLFFGYVILPKILKKIARSHEMLLLFSVAWCFTLATLLHTFNFSLEMGALIAGISLSMSPYKHDISSRMKPLRDFFLVLFFISIGSEIVLNNILDNLFPIIALSLFVMIGNALVIIVTMTRMRYTLRTSFMAGTTIAQISEFSFILIAMGITLGHLSSEMISIITAIGLITFSGSSYMMIYANPLYRKVAPYMKFFERKGKKKEEFRYKKNKKYKMAIFGCDRIGRTLLESVKHNKENTLIIDYNPDIVEEFSKKGYHVIYGDSGDVELLDEIDFTKIPVVVSTVPDKEINKYLIEKIRSSTKNTSIVPVSLRLDDALDLYDLGASYVIIPHFLGAEKASYVLTDMGKKKGASKKTRSNHIKYLRSRKKKEDKMAMLSPDKS